MKIKLMKGFILLFSFASFNAMAIEKNKTENASPTSESKTTVVSTKEITQKKSVSGVVKSADGEVLMGVSVTVKSTKSGTATDLDGKFTLSDVNNSDILVFTYLGYTSVEQTVGDQTAMNITMKEDTKFLDEVVVVGYARVKKANLTGSVDQIKGETLENRPVVTVAQALQGTIANLNISAGNSGGAPGAGQNINIRGYTGFGTAGAPLIVTDGIQGGDLKDLNPDDIESISVLKDAASAAIYGSSAPYGVIIVTTKKGKKGAAPKITYNNNFGFAQPINLPKMMNSLDFATIYNEATDNAGYPRIFSDETIQRIKDYQSGKITTETIKNPDNKKDEWYSWDMGNANNDWFNTYYKDYSFAQQHNVGISGGSENSTYYVGLGYNDKNGMYNFGDDKYQRFNVRTNLSSNLTKWLTFNFMGAFSRAIGDSPNTYAGKTGGNYMHQIARKWPTVPLFNPDGNYSETSDVLLHLNGGRDKSLANKGKLTGEFVITPLKNWDITVNYTYDGLFEDKSLHDAVIYQVLPSGKNAAVSGTTPSRFTRTNARDEHHVINAFTSYEWQLDKHYLKGLIGYTQELIDYTYFRGRNSYLYTDDIPSLSLTYGTTPTANDDTRQLAIRGNFGRINYGYDEKYLLELNYRYDGTSRFMSDVRYRFYPGASAAWVASKESFWEGIQPYVNLFKVRLSYGSLGDQSFLDGDGKFWYPFYPRMATTIPTATSWIFGEGREASITSPEFVNETLTWITNTTYDVGFDFEFLRNRLTASFDAYIRNADNHVFTSKQLPAILGAEAPKANVAALQTKGFDLTVTWRDRINDFGYGVRAVLSDYQSTVTKFPNLAKQVNDKTWNKDQKLGEIWGYETYGLFQSQEEINNAPKQTAIYASTWYPGDVRYVDYNQDDKIDFGTNTLGDTGDKHVIGNSTPRFAYGLTLDADYKGFDFSVFFQGVGKRDVFISSNYFWGINGDQWQSSPFTVHNDRWSPENPDGYFPRFYMSTSRSGKNNQVQTRYLQDASYMRIKNLQLGYTLPKSLVDKIRFDKIRIFATVENLATFTNLIETMDPEFSVSDGKIYPLQRTWSGGINITF